MNNIATYNYYKIEDYKHMEINLHDKYILSCLFNLIMKYIQNNRIQDFNDLLYRFWLALITSSDSTTQNIFVNNLVLVLEKNKFKLKKGNLKFNEFGFLYHRNILFKTKNKSLLLDTYKYFNYLFNREVELDSVIPSLSKTSSFILDTISLDIKTFNYLDISSLLKKLRDQILEKKYLIFLLKTKMGIKSSEHDNLQEVLSEKEYKQLMSLYNNIIQFEKAILSSKCEHIAILEKGDYAALIKFYAERRGENEFIYCKKCKFPLMCPHVEYQFLNPKANLNKFVESNKVKEYSVFCKICGERLYKTDIFDKYSALSHIFIEADIETDIQKFIYVQLNYYILNQKIVKKKKILYTQDIVRYVTEHIYSRLIEQIYKFNQSVTTTPLVKALQIDFITFIYCLCSVAIASIFFPKHIEVFQKRTNKLDYFLPLIVDTILQQKKNIINKLGINKQNILNSVKNILKVLYNNPPKIAKIVEIDLKFLKIESLKYNFVFSYCRLIIEILTNQLITINYFADYDNEFDYNLISFPSFSQSLSSLSNTLLYNFTQNSDILLYLKSNSSYNNLLKTKIKIHLKPKIVDLYTTVYLNFSKYNTLVTHKHPKLSQKIPEIIIVIDKTKIKNILSYQRIIPYLVPKVVIAPPRSELECANKKEYEEIVQDIGEDFFLLDEILSKIASDLYIIQNRNIIPKDEIPKYLRNINETIKSLNQYINRKEDDICKILLTLKKILNSYYNHLIEFMKKKKQLLTIPDNFMQMFKINQLTSEEENKTEVLIEGIDADETFATDDIVNIQEMDAGIDDEFVDEEDDTNIKDS